MTNHPEDRHVLAASARANASYRRVPNTVPDILVLLERTGVP